MAAAPQPLSRPPLALRAAPGLVLALLALPVLAGLAGTLLPAFGWLPALGGHGFSLEPWQRLLAQPGLATSLWTTLFTGWAATALSLLIAAGWVVLLHGRGWAQAAGRAVAPLLATPHSALAIGLAFVISPSGWLLRALSPGLTGFDRPPDWPTVGHWSGGALVLGLLLKEVPYLMLMALAALGPLQAPAQLAAARALGYGPVAAAAKVLLPQLLPRLRLPLAAVLVFSLTVVDVALVLGPGHPPTLAVLVLRWWHDPDVRMQFPAAAAAVLLLALVLASLAGALAAERLLIKLLERWAAGGRRNGPAVVGLATAGHGVALLLPLAAASLLGLALWSLAQQWRWPDALPGAWTLAHWARQAPVLAGPAAATLGLALASTALSLALTLACLELEARRRRPLATLQPVLYLPLLVPQLAFLFGAQVLLVRAGLDGAWAAVVWAHGLFVLPYLFLSLADPWRAFDERYARSALALGASPARVFWRIKLPILLKPVAVSSAVAFAVSVGLYLPTLLAGSGRVATLTTEAVTLSAGADRRVIGLWALLQALLPLGVYALALALPALLYRRRRGMQ